MILIFDNKIEQHCSLRITVSILPKLTLSHMESEVLFTIWQGGQLASPVTTTLAKVKTILGADHTLAMLCSIIVFSRVWEGG
jgi:hypothetical protein